jgi:hypothetical protein
MLESSGRSDGVAPFLPDSSAQFPRCDDKSSHNLC